MPAALNGATPPIRVVLAASDPAVGGSLARELNDAGFVVCAAEETVSGLIAAALAHAPDACVMTSDLRGSALVGVARVAAAAPRTKVIVVGVSDDDEDCLSYLLLGASGYVIRESTGASLASAVRGVVTGLAIIPPAAQRRLLDELRA